MLKVQKELRRGNGFTYKFEFYSVSMTLIFGHATNVLLMLNNNFTHQIFLLTPVFITHFVFSVAQLLQSTAPLQRGAQHAVREKTDDHTVQSDFKVTFVSRCRCSADAGIATRLVSFQ